MIVPHTQPWWLPFWLLLVISVSACNSSTTSFGPTPVTSTAIRLVGYDANTHILEIEFTTHEVYQYFNVPPAIAAGLRSAPSKGKYFNAVIKKGGYQYRHLPRNSQSAAGNLQAVTPPPAKSRGKPTASSK